MWRKLEQDRPEFRRERADAVEETVVLRQGQRQLLRMGDEAARFRREAELRGYRVAPRRQRLDAGHAVEGAVDLSGRELHFIKIEIAACRGLGWIERPDPMPV